MTNSGAPLHLKPEQAISEAAALGEKIARGAELFSQLRDEEVAIATTPKDEVWRQDKVTWSGQFRPSLDEAEVWPRPLQQPQPRSQHSIPTCYISSPPP